MTTHSKALALIIAFGLAAGTAVAGVATSTVGAGGYDLVSYHTSKRPLPGNGHFVAVHDGVTYLFASAENRAAFERDPQRYLPAYGGFCAYGVSVGKKFYGDPEVWRVVDGKLYLSLDARIQDAWLEDVSGNLEKADRHWKKIAPRSPAEL